MSLSLEQLAANPLKKVKVDENLRIKESDLELTGVDDFDIDNICEAVSQRVATILDKDKKKRGKDKKLPELAKTPYSVLITKLCRKDFDPDSLSQSEIAILGFLPISIQRVKVRKLIEGIAEKVAMTFAKEDEADNLETLSAAKESVFNAIAINFQNGLEKSFNGIPVDLSILKENLRISPKALGKMVHKLKAEGKTGDEDLLREMGFEENEISDALKKIRKAGKKAIKFYRDVNKYVSKAHTTFIGGNSAKLVGDQAWNEAYVDNSQATLFTLLEHAYMNNGSANGDTLSIKGEAQILLQIRLLCLQITNDPIYQDMEESTELLDKFVKAFYGDSTQEHVSVEIDEHGDISQSPQAMQRPITLRRFGDSGVRVYAEDRIREKEWDSIMLKIITGECSIGQIPDMLAGQFALFDMSKEDLYYEEGCEDFERIERVDNNLRFAESLLKKAANSMGCTEEASKTTHYRNLQIGQFKIERKIHGSGSNEKSHNFSAIKVYICVKGKNGTPLRVEYRGVPWNTYLDSKSVKSLNGDEIYTLKKMLIFAKYAIRKSQNERFIEVVEILLELIDKLEEDQLSQSAA